MLTFLHDHLCELANCKLTRVANVDRSSEVLRVHQPFIKKKREWVKRRDIVHEMKERERRKSERRKRERER